MEPTRQSHVNCELHQLLTYHDMLTYLVFHYTRDIGKCKIEDVKFK